MWHFENDIQNYSAFNMAFVVPKGIKIAKVKKGRDWVDDISLTARAASTHSIACNMLDDGETIKIISSTSMLDDFYPDDADGTPMNELFTLGLIAEKGMANGTYTVELWDVKFVLATADASVPASLPVLGTFTITGGMSSVERVEADGAADSGECYDLLGRKVANRPAAPGIYIRGGEKIVVK